VERTLFEIGIAGKNHEPEEEISGVPWIVPLDPPMEASMPPRIIDGDAMWASEKIYRCNTVIPATVGVFYPWFYPLADAYGSFEITSIRVIHGKVAANLEFLTIAHTKTILEEFERNGLLFVWEQDGKRFAHWTNSDRPGRLPKPSERKHYRRLAPDVPADALAQYRPRATPAPSVPPTLSLPLAEPSGFEIFWESYPRKIGKPAARKAWGKIPSAEQHFAEILAGLERWKVSQQWQDATYVPYPATFLNQRRFDDQPDNGGGVTRHEQQQRRTLQAAQRSVARGNNQGTHEVRTPLPDRID